MKEHSNTKCLNIDSLIGAPSRDSELIKKPIEFKKARMFWDSSESPDNNPKDWDYVILLAKDWSDDDDLMFAYDQKDGPSQGCLYLGRWNDGVVE